MENMIFDGLDQLTMTGYLNALEAALRVTYTDDVITAGAKTSIPVATLAKSLLPSGAVVILLDRATGTAHELTLADAAEATDTALTISSYNFPTNLPAECPIYYKVADIINSLYFAP